MRRINSIAAARAALFGLLLVVRPTAYASDLPPGGLYDLEATTVMPHLEENLRYTTTHTQRCLAQDEIHAAFPILNSASLRSCTLAAGDLKEGVKQQPAVWTLRCPPESGVTGRVTWRFDAQRLRGTLEVKMGGKNMTFSQHVTLRRAGDCPK